MADKKKKTDFRSLSMEGLNKKSLELKKELMNLRFQKTSGELEKTHRFKEARREVARVKTIVAEQKRSDKK